MTPSENEKWTPVNDVVMGGCSSSRFHVEEVQDDDSVAYAGIFKGYVTDENNGGFASVARPITQEDPKVWIGYTGIQLKYLGDGKYYQIRLRTSHKGVVTRYKFEFGPSSSEWNLITAPFSEFTATFRGRDIVNAPAIDSQYIDEVGLLISKRQLGEFCLYVKDIQLVD
jgi:hypothetical protein